MFNNDVGVCMYNICFELNNLIVYEINKIISVIFMDVCIEIFIIF